MNYRFLAKILGQLIAIFGLSFLPSLCWAAWFGEWDSFTAFLESIGVALLFGGVLYVLGRGAETRMYQRETLGLVGLGWLVLALVGAVPYVMSGTLGCVDAFFESMSGLTTTGSTVIVDIEAVDKSVLFWRSFSHWLGGMGVIVLFIAVLPYLGAGGKQLFKSEAPGPDPHGLSPRIRDTASILWKLYLTLTVVQTACLMLAGMSLYDALCHTFGTLATGGFSTRQASIAAFDSLAIEVIIIVFMVVAGTNFGLFFAMKHGDIWAVVKDSEWRYYLGILVLATVLISFNLMGFPANGVIDETPEAMQVETPDFTPGGAVRVASFQVVSVMTTTGYGTNNFEKWPPFSQLLLLMLMFVGGCAGSTGGGIKVVRIIVLCKMAYWRLENTFRPKTVRPIRMGDHLIDDGLQKRVATFLMLHMLVFIFGSLVMAGMGLPVMTAVTAVIATLNNIGPGLEFVGAGHDFHLVPDAGKVLLSFFMAMGRLELFSIVVMLHPGFWKHS